MTCFKNKYRIESARLRGWDYATSAWYYITICIKDRACVFGKIAAGEMELSEVGEIACQCWLEIPLHSSAHISLDEYLVMPDHIHGIIVIDGKDVGGRDVGGRDVGGRDVGGRDVGGRDVGGRDVGGRDVACNVSTTTTTDHGTRTGMSAISPRAGSLGAIVRSFKSAVTRTCRAKHLSQFEWQERYFDHIIRTEAQLERIRRYITANPARWNPKSDTRQDLWM